MARLFPILFLMIFVAFGVVFLGYGLGQIFQAHQATQWPMVQGEIVSSELKSHTNKNSHSWRCEVQYAYQVEGVSYRGDRIAFGYDGTNREKLHADLHRKLKAAEVVDVYYNPANPSESCLVPGIRRSAFLMIVFGLAWLGFVFSMMALVVCDVPVRKFIQRLEHWNSPSAHISRSVR
ncbi:DUF3592 domain-containing protein [Bremerella cremea]|uniref:DUF3592 domain-containing protein n=1 Tax=Bremerella cremea TaxID=1031537 RepID=UPI0031E54526